MRALIRWGVRLKLSVTLLLVTGCASFARVASDIPAMATPAREARYLHSQDVPYFLAGMATDEAVRTLGYVPGLGVLKGPYRCGPPGNFCHKGAPFLRAFAVMGLVVAHRYASPDYRESGALFAVSGSWVWEVVRCAASSQC